MGGILLILLFIIGFIVYVWLIRLPIKWAKNRGIEGRKLLYISIASFFVVSAIFFGKNLISYTAFKYYCKNEAGMTVYKTLEEWKQENPGVWETLKKVNDFRNYEDRDKYPDVELKKNIEGKEYGISYGLGNQRIISYYRDNNLFWGAINENIYILFDNVEKKILSKYKYYTWTNTWDTTTNRDGYRTGSVFGKVVCSPDRHKSSMYDRSFSNLSLTEEEK